MAAAELGWTVQMHININNHVGCIYCVGQLLFLFFIFLFFLPSFWVRDIMERMILVILSFSCMWDFLYLASNMWDLS